MVTKHASMQAGPALSVDSLASTARSRPQVFGRGQPAAPGTGLNLTVRVDSPSRPENRALIRDAQSALRHALPAEAGLTPSRDDMAAPNVTFFVARVDMTPVGCATLVDYTSYGEARQVYVRDTFRGRGITEALMLELEQYCRDIGILRVKLESSTILKTAGSLHDRLGFAPCAPFGNHAITDHSLFLEKVLGRLN